MLLLDKCDTNDIYYVFYSLIYQEAVLNFSKKFFLA